MLKIGNFNTLTIIKRVPFGYYLDAGQHDPILLPNRYALPDMQINSAISVFIYRDSDDRLIATTQQPLAQVGQFAWLRVVAVTPQGAFLDWGLPKDLLVPFREQKITMREGKHYIVAIFLDRLTNRIAASSKIHKYLNKQKPELSEGQQVNILISSETPIGFTAIINNLYTGLLYKTETFQPLPKGQHCQAYIKNIREDNKIDLCLQKPGTIISDQLEPLIINQLKNNNGFLPLTDKTSAEQIYSTFHESKKSFKRALGSLYKQRLITIHPDGIRLTNN